MRMVQQVASVQKAPRQSNMELLRIVSMTMIIVDHFLLHAIFRGNMEATAFRLAYPFLACGVNLFFLLSGYFKIRLSIPSILKLVLLVLMFRILGYVLYVIGGGLSELR